MEAAALVGGGVGHPLVRLELGQLGAPAVSARPLADRPSVVGIAVMWELSWYRFEVDLSDEGSGARRAGQGAELSELPPEEQIVNAAADERGGLHLAAAELDG